MGQPRPDWFTTKDHAWADEVDRRHAQQDAENLEEESPAAEAERLRTQFEAFQAMASPEMREIVEDMSHRLKLDVYRFLAGDAKGEGNPERVKRTLRALSHVLQAGLGGTSGKAESFLRKVEQLNVEGIPTATDQIDRDWRSYAQRSRKAVEGDKQKE